MHGTCCKGVQGEVGVDRQIRSGPQEPSSQCLDKLDGRKRCSAELGRESACIGVAWVEATLHEDGMGSGIGGSSSLLCLSIRQREGEAVLTAPMCLNPIPSFAHSHNDAHAAFVHPLPSYSGCMLYPTSQATSSTCTLGSSSWRSPIEVAGFDGSTVGRGLSDLYSVMVPGRRYERHETS